MSHLGRQGVVSLLGHVRKSNLSIFFLKQLFEKCVTLEHCGDDFHDNFVLGHRYTFGGMSSCGRIDVRAVGFVLQFGKTVHGEELLPDVPRRYGRIGQCRLSFRFRRAQPHVQNAVENRILGSCESTIYFAPN